MDKGAQSGPSPPSLSGTFFSFVLSLEDMQSRKDLAEDWLGDRDGILVFSGLFSTMIFVFIIGGNYKMRCNPIAEHALLIAKMSNELIGMINGTHQCHHEGTPLPPAVPDRPAVSLLINVIWTISLTFSLASTFFGIMVRRWAVRYLFNNLHRIDTRIPRHIRSRVSNDLVTSWPLSLVTLIRFFLPLSVALFFLGLVIFMVHVGVSASLVFISSLVVAWFLFYGV